MRIQYSRLQGTDDDQHLRMERLTSNDSADSPPRETKGSHARQTSDETRSLPSNSMNGEVETLPQDEYRVYKRRWLGLAQLVLLNLMVSWDWLTFAAVSTTASQYFQVSESSINWLSTAFLFAFVAVSPLVLWTLSKGGPKDAIVAASGLMLVGSWIRYAGARATGGHFGVVMFGQIVIGFAQPFVLTAPTRYSNLWFSDKGRVSATAVASLANPLGGALGQLIGPLWATSTSGIPSMVLYTAIITTVACLPGPFVPRAPPTPPSAIAASETLDLGNALRELPKNGKFFLLFLPFSVYVGFFNATSSLLNQILEPYGFSETDAGIAGGLLIVVGLIASAIVSPIIDRTKTFVLSIKVIVPLLAAAYIALIFMPPTQSIVGPYVVCAVLGATSFSLLPCVLEYFTVITHPISAEITSVIGWVGGQLLGGIFIIVMTALRGGWKGEPDGSMTRALVFQAVIACVVVPLPLLLGVGRFKTWETTVTN